MKITAEFNSNEELLNFMRTFGGVAPQEEKVGQTVKIQPAVVKSNGKEKTEQIKSKVKSEDNTPKVEAEVVGVDATATETKDAEIVEEQNKEDKKITKEEIRAMCAKAMKAGKQTEVKNIVAKYGAKKVPDLKEENYAEIYKELEEIL